METPTEAVADKGEDLSITFMQLQMASLYPENRAFYEGKTVKLVGQYVGDTDSRFTLVRYAVRCCAADAVPVNAVIMLDPNAASKEKLDPEKLRGKWVEVTGRVEFVKRAGKADEYVTALLITPTKDRPLKDMVKEVPAPADPFLN